MDHTKYVQALVRAAGNEEKAAKLAKVHQSTINRWLKGSAIRQSNMPDFLNALKEISIPLDDLNLDTIPTPKKREDSFAPEIISGKGLVGDKSLPVFAAAMGGEGHQIITFDAIDWVKRPSILENVKDAYAVYIVGESMIPAFRPADLALIHPHLPLQRDTDVVLFHVPPSDEAECIIKRLLGYNDRDWRLEQYNPYDEFSEPRESWPICHRVVGKYSSR